MKKFNVIWFNYNTKKFEEYDIIPYLVESYNKEHINPKPQTFEEFKDFVKSQSMYQWWSRCEYEIILKDFPNGNTKEKWDIHKQILMNLDIITSLVMESIIK